jgi:benzylsuccinate CoA-transferase BbsF subunit
MSPFRDGEPGINRSGYFANRNSSKRSVIIDLKDQSGRDVALRLIAASDVVASNFTPGTLDRLGLGYEAARLVRPDIVYLEMPMQGAEGPHSGFRGYGLTIAAAGGFLELSGYPDRPPVGTGTNYPDHVPNPLHATVAVLAALHQRSRGAGGRLIELAQLESTINAIGPAVVAAAAGIDVDRAGNDDVVACPHGVFPCAGDDRWCAIAVETDTQWLGLVAALDAPALRDPRWTRNARRRSEQDALEAALSAVTREHEAEELARRLAEAGVPAYPVLDAAGVLHDEQLRDRGHWVTLDHPEMGPSVYDGIPYRLSQTPGRLQSAAPLLGADTRDVCVELLGMTPDEYDTLARDGVVG